MYTDQLRVESFLQRELTDNEASNLDDVIAAVSTQIDEYTGRSWLPVDEDESGDLEAEPRYFDGNGCSEIWIDDFIGLEEVVILDSQGNDFTTFSEETDWQTLPLNKNPKTSLRLRTSRFPHGIGNVKVTAIWGTGSAPKDVIVACTEMVSKYMMRAAESGPFKKESIEGYSRELASDSDFAVDTVSVLSRLDHYKRIIL